MRDTRNPVWKHNPTTEQSQLPNTSSSLSLYEHFLQGNIANKNFFVIGIRKKASFELGKEIEKFVFRFVTSMEQRKNTESPWEIEPQTFGFRPSMLYH